jgi:phosphatidylserine/phosphatidylglycerophosphate/cardiolipin synthase-like enzyme
MEVVMLRYIYLLFFALNVTAMLASEEGGRRDSTYVPLCATRLVTDADHTRFLVDTLSTATNTVMISTYNVSPKKLFDEGIGQAIIDAAERGVAVYVYYENRPYYSKEDYADLETVASYCERFEDNANHSKCVIKDKSTVAIGSHNWLSDPWEGSSNGSMIITGGLALGLINDVWQGIRFYQSLEHGNQRGIKKFLKDKDAFSTGEYQFASGQFLYTLRTPEAHGIFLGEVFQKAKARVLLFSPFIRLAKLKETFSSDMLRGFQHRGVCIKIITLPSPCDRVPQEQKDIFAHLNGLSTNFVNFSYVTYPKFHAKTLIADDLICEGSFNWLSAVTQIDHDANNFEMSVAVKGDIGSAMIQEFEQTDLGKFVLAKSKIAQPLSLKREASVELKEKRQSLTEKKTPRINQVLDIIEPPFDPRKRAKVIPTKVPQNFDREIRIYSGEKYGIAGFCVRFNNGDYLRDGQDIVYFATPEEAKKAAYDFWKK